METGSNRQKDWLGSVNVALTMQDYGTCNQLGRSMQNTHSANGSNIFHISSNTNTNKKLGKTHSANGSELHNVKFFTQIKIWVKDLPQKRVNCDWFVFVTKFMKTWFVCSYFNSYFFSSKYLHQPHSIWVKKYPNEIISKYFTPYLYLFGLNVQVSGVKLPQWNGPFS